MIICLTRETLLVQLMPGTEVVVAPKRRKKSLDSTGDSHLDSSNKEHAAKMLLRLQYPDGLCSTKLPILMSKELSFL